MMPIKYMFRVNGFYSRIFLYLLMVIAFFTISGLYLRMDISNVPLPNKVFNYLSYVYKKKTLDNKYNVTANYSNLWDLSEYHKNDTVPLCPLISPLLNGSNIEIIKALKKTIPEWDYIESLHPELLPGGRHKPLNCVSRHKVAIIIPFRNRDEHLRAFTYYMHPFLQKQQLDYGIYVAEQMGNNSFNRAMLMNIGFVEALKQYDFKCFIFHDVDLLPEIDQNLYVCSQKSPRHFSASINTHGYKLPYKTIFGGVGGLTLKQFQNLNGFSNQFWGWGGEDDDMYNRLHKFGYSIQRYSQPIARYTMMTHKKEVPSPQRFRFLNSGHKRFKTDGINSLKYERVDVKLKKLYTLIQVKIKQK